MAITVNLYYSGKNGSASAFAREMQETGVVDAIGRRIPAKLTGTRHIFGNK